MSDFVQLVIVDPRSPARGTVLDRWESYEFNNDLFTPADTFKFRLRVGVRADAISVKQMENAREVVGEETVVQLRVKDGTVLATGIIDDVFTGGDREGGPYLELSGRDGMAVFQDNITTQKLRLSNTTFPVLVDSVVDKYRNKGIPFNIVTDNEANRDIMTGRRRVLSKRVGAPTSRVIHTSAGTVTTLNTVSRPDKVPSDFVRYPINEARPHGGETEYAFLDRHARNLGVMMWTSTGGDIVLSRPNYDQDVIFRLQRKIRGGAQNNILEGGRRRNRGNTATAVRLFGHTSGRGDFKKTIVADVKIVEKGNTGSVTRIPQVQQATGIRGASTSLRVIEAQLAANTYIWPRVRAISDGNAKDHERARREAQRALARHNVNLEALEYTVLDYSQNGVYFCPDTLAYVDDEWSGAKGVYYIVARNYMKSRSGAKVQLRLIPKGAYVLD